MQRALLTRTSSNPSQRECLKVCRRDTTQESDFQSFSDDQDLVLLFFDLVHTRSFTWGSNNDSDGNWQLILTRADRVMQSRVTLCALTAQEFYKKRLN